jgi:hypothetical protein
MKTNIAAFCAAVLTVAALGAAPASAASFHNTGGEFQNAQFTFGGSDRGRGNQDRFERRGNAYFFNGFRGERERRSGWRQHRGFWFPPSAFSFSITIDSDRYRVRLSARHVAWCEDHYRSYRHSDNSFKPYNGPRRECISPYYGA